MHGYDMNELQEIAKDAVIHNRHHLGQVDYAECIKIAWEGVVTALCEAKAKPERNDLLYAGYAVVRQEVRSERRDRGTPDAAQGTTGRGFAKYWATSKVTPSFEESVVDRLAFRQIWRSLTAAQRQALIVGALNLGHGQVQVSPAAAMLGVSERSFEGKIRRGREAFRRKWET